MIILIIILLSSVHYTWCAGIFWKFRVVRGLVLRTSRSYSYVVCSEELLEILSGTDKSCYKLVNCHQ